MLCLLLQILDLQVWKDIQGLYSENDILMDYRHSSIDASQVNTINACYD